MEELALVALLAEAAKPVLAHDRLVPPDVPEIAREPTMGESESIPRPDKAGEPHLNGQVVPFGQVALT